MKKMKIKTAYLVYKRSVYQKYYLEEKNEKFKKLFQRRHFSVQSVRGIHDVHLKAVRRIQNYLKRRGIACTTDSRHKLTHFDGIDLIITVGGDGTFLRTARFVENQLVLPINSDPQQSVGALCSATIHDFKSKMDEILSGKSRVKKLPRMRIRVNGKPLGIEAVNDALFTNISPAATSRYYVKLGRDIEEHKSSGVWVATATGSTAAISAAGGEQMELGDKRLQFATREPYQGNFHPYRLTRGYIAPGKKLLLINKMIQAKIYVDGPTHSYDLNYGDEIEFSLSRKILRVVS